MRKGESPGPPGPTSRRQRRKDPRPRLDEGTRRKKTGYRQRELEALGRSSSVPSDKGEEGRNKLAYRGRAPALTRGYAHYRGVGGKEEKKKNSTDVGRSFSNSTSSILARRKKKSFSKRLPFLFPFTGWGEAERKDNLLMSIRR